MPILSLFLFLTTSGIRVTGAATCPSTDAVQNHLEVLLGEKNVTGWSATLRHTPGGVQVALVEGDGTVVSQRVMPSDRPCEDLANIAALLLASWLSDLTSQAVSAEPLPGLSLPAPIASEPGNHSWSWEVGLAPTGSFTGGSLAPGGLLQLEAGPADARWALRIAGLYDGPRQAPEGPGAVSWQRFQGDLGATYELSRSPYSLEIGGDIVFSDLLLRGLQFPADASATSLDPGIDISFRLAALRGPWHPWVGVWATLWTRQEVPLVQGLTLQATLPQVEACVGLGFSWRSSERF